MQLKQKIFYESIFMLITPVFGLIRSLKGVKSKVYKKWMLTVFSTIYASTFSIENIGDGTVHWQKVYDYYVDLSFSQFIADLGDILTFRTNEFVNEDVYIHLLSYFVGNILSAPGLFFVFVGFVYGYFFSASMVKLFDIFPHWKKHTGVFILAIYFICILNLQSMNTVRTWTGFWVLFYSVLQYHDTRKLKYLILMLTPPLIHIGYFAMALPVWGAFFVRLPRMAWIGIYVISFATTIINPSTALKNLEQTEVGQEKVKGYYVEEQSTIAEKIESQKSTRWYRVYYKSGLLPWAVVLITLFFIINGDYIKRMAGLETKLFSIGLLTKAFSNTTWFLFALSNRSMIISNLMILAAILLFWQRKRNINFNIINKPLWISSLILITPSFIYYLSNTIEYLSAYIIAFPIITWVGESVKITIRGLLGIILGID